MVGAETSAVDKLEAYVLPARYATDTRVNCERRVADQLAEHGVEIFRPHYESEGTWIDRKVCVRMPLFSGYVFVRLLLQNRLGVLRIPGVASPVGFAGRPVPEAEFTKIRGFLQQGLRAEPHPYLQAGRRVQVRSVPLQGMEGIILRRKNSCRLVISLELIQRAMAVDVDSADVEALPQRPGDLQTP